MLATVAASIASPLDGALYMAALGIGVFPCKPGKKTPIGEGWQELVTTDPAAIRAMAARHPGCNWGAYGKGVVCIDVDSKVNPETGEDGFDQFLKLPPLPRTLMVKTPRVGLHAWLRGEFASGKLDTSIDFRARGQYALCPGSVFQGRAYTISLEAPIADAPAWLVERMAKPRERAAGGGPAVLGELDTPERIAEATRLAQELEPSVEGKGGDLHAVKVANRIGDCGVSEAVCLEVMTDHWLDRGTHDPGHSYSGLLDWLELKVHSAYQTRDNPLGVRPPVLPVAEQFEPIAVDMPPGLAPAPKAQAVARSHFPMIHNEPRDRVVNWLVKDLIPRGVLGFIAGKPKSGKSFLSIHLACCVATGTPFYGRKVRKRAGVIYVAAEGGNGLPQRFRAAQDNQPEKFGTENLPIAWLNAAPAGIEGEGLAPLIEGIELHKRFIRETFGIDVGLIVFDTFAQTVNLSDENAAAEVSKATKALIKIGTVTGLTVLAVHHLGKDKTKGMRGSSVLNADLEFQIDIDENRRVELSLTRESEPAELGAARLVSVVVGHDEDGDAVRSAYLTEVAPGEDFEPIIPEHASAGVQLLFECFRAVAGDNKQAPEDEVRELFYAKRGGSATANRQAFRRAKDAMPMLEPKIVGGKHVLICVT